MAQMHFKYLRCGICGQWHRFGEICHHCGAYRVVTNGRVNYYNRSLIRMGRAIPLSLETTIDRVILRAINEYEREESIKKPEYVKPNWRIVKLLLKSGIEPAKARAMAIAAMKDKK